MLAENSDVLPAVVSVAVVVTCWPAPSCAVAKLNDLLPVDAFVVTVVEPRSVKPSPWPDGSATTTKNSILNSVLGRLLRVPERMVTPFDALFALDSTG